MHMPRSQQRAHYHIRLNCAQLTLKAQNTGHRASEHTLLPNVVHIKEIILANVSLVFDFPVKLLFSLWACLLQDEEGGRCCQTVFKPIGQFLPPPNTFHVPLKGISRMLMPKLHSSVHLRAFFLFYINSLSHIIQTGLNYTRSNHKTQGSNESPPGFLDGLIKCVINL